MDEQWTLMPTLIVQIAGKLKAIVMASTTAFQTIIGNKTPTAQSTDIGAVPWHQVNPAISSNPLAKLNSLDITAQHTCLNGRTVDSGANYDSPNSW